MRTLLLQLLFIFCCFEASAQQVQMQVTTNVEEILLQQTWSIDDPQTEFALPIIEGIYTELNAFYELLNLSTNGSFVFDFTTVDALIQEADQLEINLNAFDSDFQLMDSYR